MNGRKLLAATITCQSTSLVLGIRDTKFDVLDEEAYCFHMDAMVEQAQGIGVIIISVTIDNEPSQNAGVRR